MQQIQYDTGGYLQWTNADWVDAVSKKVQGLKPHAAGALGNYLLPGRVAFGVTTTARWAA